MQYILILHVINYVAIYILLFAYHNGILVHVDRQKDIRSVA